MKNKKLRVCLIVFASLVLVIVLTSAIFALKNISLDFFGETDKLSGSEQTIIDSADFKQGSNVLFMKKNYYISKIEKKNPYVKVVNIETVFPNSIIIHCTERVELLAVKQTDNTYAILDEDLKVLNVVNHFENTDQNAIIIQGLGNISPQNAGDFLSLDARQNELVKSTINSLKEWKLSPSVLKQKVEFVCIDYERENQVLVKMRSGVKIVVKDANILCSDKFNMAFSAYESNTKYQTSGTLEVRITESNEMRIFFYTE